MAKNVGTLIREARTAAGLSQAELAKRAGNLTSTDISKAERGEKSLTQAQLKQIAKATGVAQTALLNAPKGGVSSAGSSATSGPATPSIGTSFSAIRTSPIPRGKSGSPAATSVSARRRPFRRARASYGRPRHASTVRSTR